MKLIRKRILPLLLMALLLIAAVILVARRLKKTSARYRDEDRQEPKFHGPVYTVDYKDVDDEDEKDK